MIVKCPCCETEYDIGDAKREECFCGECGASLRDLTETIEHNQREIEKLRWQPRPEENK